MPMGEAVYLQHCAPPAISRTVPARASRILLRPAAPISTGPVDVHIDRVLNGVVDTEMQSWAPQLSDLDIAAVITYERNAFGNDMGDSSSRSPSSIPARVSTMICPRRHHTPGKASADRTGFLRWVLTTNHKEIGTLYLCLSFAMFIVGGAMAHGIPPGTGAAGACSSSAPTSTTRW